jgi:hypothetical protein
LAAVLDKDLHNLKKARIGAARRLNRETGAIPVRTRRCHRGRSAQDATVWLKPYGKARDIDRSESQKTCHCGCF